MIRSLLIALSLVLSPLALADNHAKMPEPTKEDRTKMADMHTKMAECLKSDKTMADCHKDMAASCPMAGKDGKCPMMGMMGKHEHGKGKSCACSKGEKTKTE